MRVARASFPVSSLYVGNWETKAHPALLHQGKPVMEGQKVETKRRGRGNEGVGLASRPFEHACRSTWVAEVWNAEGIGHMIHWAGVVG